MLKNSDLYQNSLRVIPSGVNSPVRAFGAVGGVPRFIRKGKGSKIWDSEGNCFIDYICSWGPLVLGHANVAIVRAISDAAAEGSTFGAPTERELQMAEKLVRNFKSVEKIRLVSSGTEATMSAVRLSRGYTRRDKIIKFEGCYHGHVDSLLVEAGSGALTFGQPSSAGVTGKATEDTITLAYGNYDDLKSTFKKYGDEIAAVIIEPVAGNMNLVIPEKDYLLLARQLCNQFGSILVFEEVMTGFRVGLQGAQGVFDIEPDLTTLGKVIGGGLPMGAFGGKADIMDQLAPAGPVYQAGTLSGNPVAVAAGLTTLDHLMQVGVFESIVKFTNNLVRGLREAAEDAELEFSAQSLGTMFGFSFSKNSPQNLVESQSADHEKFRQFFHLMLEEGVYLAPSPFEAGFTSAAHNDQDLEKTISSARIAFGKIVEASEVRR